MKTKIYCTDSCIKGLEIRQEYYLARLAYFADHTTIELISTAWGVPLKEIVAFILNYHMNLYNLFSEPSDFEELKDLPKVKDLTRLSDEDSKFEIIKILHDITTNFNKYWSSDSKMDLTSLTRYKTSLEKLKLYYNILGCSHQANLRFHYSLELIDSIKLILSFYTRLEYLYPMTYNITNNFLTYMLWIKEFINKTKVGDDNKDKIALEECNTIINYLSDKIDILSKR